MSKLICIIIATQISTAWASSYMDGDSRPINKRPILWKQNPNIRPQPRQDVLSQQYQEAQNSCDFVFETLWEKSTLRGEKLHRRCDIYIKEIIANLPEPIHEESLYAPKNFNNNPFSTMPQPYFAESLLDSTIAVHNKIADGRWAEKKYERAKSALSRGSYKFAKGRFEAVSELADGINDKIRAYAMYDLAEIYYLGLGCEVDHDKAKDLWEKVASTPAGLANELRKMANKQLLKRISYS